jgi:hypothetical protein
MNSHAADELARGPRLNASMMLRLTGGRVRGKSLNENQGGQE